MRNSPDKGLKYKDGSTINKNRTSECAHGSHGQIPFVYVWLNRSVRVSCLLLLFLTVYAVYAAPALCATSILYFEPKSETKISKSLKRARLSVPVYRIGVASIGGQRICMIQFGVPVYSSKTEISRNAVEIIFSAFGSGVETDRVDVYGTDKPDVKGRKGKVLFSVSAKKEDFHKVDYSLPSTDALKTFGLIYYSDTIPDKPRSWYKSIKRQYYLFRLERAFKKMNALKLKKEKMMQMKAQKKKAKVKTKTKPVKKSVKQG